MKRLTITFFLLAIFCCSNVLAQGLNILPKPVSAVRGEGSLVLPHTVTIAYDKSLCSEAKMLRSYLQSRELKVRLTHDERVATICLRKRSYILPEQLEGYMLHINSSQAIISSSTSTGVFYGIQTLQQLLHKSTHNLCLPISDITDYPSFQWRGFMLDEARNFKGVKEVKCILDNMASLKMNVFHWHLTNDQGWRIEIKKYPLLTRIGSKRDSTELYHFDSNVFDGKPHSGFYTQRELKDIVRYAAARHITVVPEITMPGHATAAIASYAWLGTEKQSVKVSPKFGVHYNVFDVTDPKVIQFISDVFDEVIRVFPSPIIHIGGDEVRYNHWKSSDHVKKYMKDHNISTPAELQVDFTNRISEMLSKKGRRMIGWNEITGDKINHYQSADDTRKGKTRLSPNTIVEFWKGNPELIKKTIRAGHDVVNAYHVYTYLDYPYNSISLKKSYSFDPIPAELTPSEQKKVLGLSCQMWGEFIPKVSQMNHMIYPRIAAYAEVGWTPKSLKDFSDFEQRLKFWQERVRVK